MKPADKEKWAALIAAAKTPEERARVWRNIMDEFDRQLKAEGLSDAEREALVAEIMLDDDEQ